MPGDLLLRLLAVVFGTDVVRDEVLQRLHLVEELLRGHLSLGRLAPQDVWRRLDRCACLEPRCVSGQEAGPNGGKEAGRQLFYSPLGLLHGRLELPETGRPAPTSRRRLPAGSSCALRQT